MSVPKPIDWDKILDDYVKDYNQMTPQQWREQYMSICSRQPYGYYDEKGTWQRTKFCFTYCGEHCDCGPPLGVWQLEIPVESPTMIEIKTEDDKKGP